MNAREFFYLVSQMRDSQKMYFKSRDTFDLRRARLFENQVDAEIKRVKEIISAMHEETDNYADGDDRDGNRY